MTERVNTIAAIGTFSADGIERVDVPEDINEVVAVLDAIYDKYDWGNVVSEEDKSIIASYLPVIGVANSEVTEDNALVGTGTFAFDRDINGCEVHAEGMFAGKGVGEGRIEWYGDMMVTKTGGDACISNFDFTFAGMGFGVGPTGDMKVIYKREMSRRMNGTESASSAFADRYTLAQWGFYYRAQSELDTNKGAIVIR